MTTSKICLASDNWSPAHPEILAAIAKANEGYAASYGADLWTKEAQELIQATFNSACKVFILPNGTGANVFALALSCRRHESVICTDIAHINYQESGAAESIVGSKLLAVPHKGGKISVEAVLAKLKTERAFGKHSTSPKLLSITEPTEFGTVYTLDELRALANLCKTENLLLHIDGSRLYNAAVFLNCSLAEIVQAAKPDILSLGGTKNGLIGAEALLIFNNNLENGSDFSHKQCLQLLSKMRYFSAQYIPFFKDNLWYKLASAANQKAQEIAAIIETHAQCSLTYPVETNQIFFTLPRSLLPRLEDNIFCLPWDQEKNQIRFVTSWTSSDQDVANVQKVFTKLF